MLLTYPDYYRQFHCQASDCEDTCCAGWQIMIDEKSLSRYRNMKGGIGNRLHNSVDWEEGSFLQYEGKCAFLNEDGLCDLYSEAGRDSLCRTCRNYPRHIEEFEGSREITLSLSCPEACRLILGNQKKVGFLTFEKETPPETYDFFDYLLYSKLCDLRTCMISILQDRRLSMRLRLSMVLALGHDADGHIRKKESSAVDDLIAHYTRPGAADRFEAVLERKLQAWQSDSQETAAVAADSCNAKEHSQTVANAAAQTETMTAVYSDLDYMAVLHKLEVLRPAWSDFVKQAEEKLRSSSDDSASGIRMSDIELEQMAVYYLSTYLVGAVYDEEIFSKVRFTVWCTLMTERLIRTEPSISPESDFKTIVDIAHRFSREIEHSDPNLKTLAVEFRTNPAYRLLPLLSWVQG